jgi:RNA 2',3'-cyclic 3'-phosphodiesterase
LFVAVPLPQTVARSVAALVEGVRAADGVAVVGPVAGVNRGIRDVRWVRLDGLHITLRFIGPTLDARLEDVAAAIRAAAGEGHSFEVGLVGAGAFPSPDRPRALWLGIGAGGIELGELARRLDDALTERGWPPDQRPFRPHLTLARSDGIRAGPRLARRLIAAADGFAARWRAESMVLFESRTGGGPARYVPLMEAAFGGATAGRPPAVGTNGTTVETLIGARLAGDTIDVDSLEPPPPVPGQGAARSS